MKFLQIIKHIYFEISHFPGSKTIFAVSLFTNLPRIMRDKTILTMRFFVPISILSNGKKIQIHNYYELPFYNYDYTDIIECIKDNSLLIDIGAHFGEVSYRHLIKNKSFAYLFEPNPNNATIIEEMFRKNKIKNYKLFRTALGAIDEKSMLSIANPLSYEGKVNNKSGDKNLQNISSDAIPIIVRRFDNIKLSKIDSFMNVFIKIDVEGYEYEVISGMMQTLKMLDSKKKGIRMMIEIKKKNNYNKILAMMRKNIKRIKVTRLTREDYYFKNA